MTPHTEERKRRIGAAMCGLRRYWTRERLLEWGHALGRKPTLIDVIPRQKAVTREFGGIRGFQEALGYEPNSKGRPRRINKEESP